MAPRERKKMLGQKNYFRNRISFYIRIYSRRIRGQLLFIIKLN